MKIAQRNLEGVKSNLCVIENSLNSWNSSADMKMFFGDLIKQLSYIRMFVYNSLANDANEIANADLGKTFTKDDIPTEFFTTIDFAISAYERMIATNEISSNLFQTCANDITKVTNKIKNRCVELSNIIHGIEMKMDEEAKRRSNMVNISQSDVIALSRCSSEALNLIIRYQLNGHIGSNLKVQDDLRAINAIAVNLARKF